MTSVLAAVIVAVVAWAPPAQAPGATRAPSLVVEAFPDAMRMEVRRLQQRVEREPRSAAASGELAMLLHAHEQHAAAAEWYDHARRLDARAFDWAYGAGLAHAANGDHDRAIAALRDAVRLAPASTPARVKFGDALLVAGAIDESAAVFAALAKDVPGLPQADYGLGRAAAARGDRTAAARHFTRALELFADYGAARYALALVYRDLGEIDKAEAELARYRQHQLRAPPLPDAFRDRVDAFTRPALRHLNAGVAAGEQGDLATAIREHERALAADPTLAQGHVHLLTLYGRTGDDEAAERHYRAALALGSHAADAHFNYGVLQAYRSRPAEARAAFTRAIEVNPFHAPAHNNLGQLDERDGKLAAAAAHYDRAVAADPQYRVARFNLGRMLIASGRLDEAIAQLQGLLAPADAETPTYEFALAAAYVRKGDLDRARQHAQAALDRAKALGQHELAAAIARDLDRLKR